MDEMKLTKSRELWPDLVKVIACGLVVLGHFSQSIIKSGFMNGGVLYEWFQLTIYSFHVPLFFICSGYLYQKYSHVNSVGAWWFNVRKKAISLGVPYLVFTLLTLVMKAFAGNLANSAEIGPLQTLLFHPTAPYWFLYTLFFRIPYYANCVVISSYGFDGSAFVFAKADLCGRGGGAFDAVCS